MANGQMAMPRWRRWLPYSIPIRNRTPRREPATSPDPSQDATCVVPPYTGRETVDSPRRPVPLPKRSRSGSATIRSVPPRMKYPDGTHCDRPRLGAAGSTSSVFGARDRGLAPDTVRHQEPAHAMLKCAVERRVFLVGANPTQRLSLPLVAARCQRRLKKLQTWRVKMLHLAEVTSL